MTTPETGSLSLSLDKDQNFLNEDTFFKALEAEGIDRRLLRAYDAGEGHKAGVIRYAQGSKEDQYIADRGVSGKLFFSYSFRFNLEENVTQLREQEFEEELDEGIRDRRSKIPIVLDTKIDEEGENEDRQYVERAFALLEREGVYQAEGPLDFDETREEWFLCREPHNPEAKKYYFHLSDLCNIISKEQKRDLTPEEIAAIESNLEGMMEDGAILQAIFIGGKLSKITILWNSSQHGKKRKKS